MCARRTILSIACGSGIVRRNKEMVKAVVGANWGDEGKGKITDMLAKEADKIGRAHV